MTSSLIVQASLAFRILLHIPRHVRIASTANRDIKRWARPARISQSLTKTHLFDEAFSPINVFNAIVRIASPHAVAMDLNLFRQAWANSIKVNYRTGQSAASVKLYRANVRFSLNRRKSLLYSDLDRRHEFGTVSAQGIPPVVCPDWAKTSRYGDD